MTDKRFFRMTTAAGTVPLPGLALAAVVVAVLLGQPAASAEPRNVEQPVETAELEDIQSLLTTLEQQIAELTNQFEATEAQLSGNPVQLEPKSWEEEYWLRQARDGH